MGVDGVRVARDERGRSIPAEFVEPGLLTLNRAGQHLQLAFVLDVAGDVPAHHIVSAVRGVVAAFPVLGCRYEKRFWRDAWVPAPDLPIARIVREHVLASLDEQTRSLAVEPIDPFAAWPFRVDVVRSPGAVRFVVSAVHLVVDGHGLLCLVSEICAQLVGRSAPNGPMDRGVGQLMRSFHLADWLLLCRQVLREGLRPFALPFVGRWDGAFQTRRPATIEVAHVTLPAEVVAEFIARCKRVGATVNDGLVAVAARIAGKRSHGSRSGAAYTVNLRRFLSDSPPITANLTGASLVILPRSLTVGEVDALLRSVSRKTGDQKRSLPGLSFLMMPALVLGWVPHALLHRPNTWVFRLFSGPMQRLQTITNVGVVDSYVAPLEDRVLAAFMIAPFGAGFPTPIVMATTFRGSMTLSFAADGLTGLGDLVTDWRNALEEFAC